MKSEARAIPLVVGHAVGAQTVARVLQDDLVVVRCDRSFGVHGSLFVPPTHQDLMSGRIVRRYAPK
jgi:hypothetical protein